TITGGWGGLGGGIEMNYSNPNIANIIIVDNYGKKGGGIYMNRSNPVLTNVTVDDNYQRGIYVNWSTPVLYGCLITDNISQGSGISANGGGILVIYSYFTMYDGEITDNTSGNKGGGMEFKNSDGLLSGVKIHHNAAGLEEAWCHGGGGINLENSSPTILNTEIYENHACAGMTSYCSGGGIRWKGGVGSPLLINVLIRDNTAYDWAGLLLYSPVLINCTIADNSSTAQVGFVGTGTIVNSVIRKGSS
ncbi:uncharacterized protein METZ01_LOCUS468809, partial [marine metagenome]